MISYERDGVRYAKKELPRNSTLAVLKSDDKDLYKLYREIENRMENKYESFSLVFDGGILIHSSSDDFIGFIMSITAQDDDIVICTTGDRQFKLTAHNQKVNPVQYDRILTASRIPDGDFTNVFLTTSNSVSVNGHTISAFIDNNCNEIVVCDDVKRRGYLAAYNDLGYLVCNDDRLFLFLFGHPDCDISSQFQELGFFWIDNEDILFRTNYGYRCTQDFIVRDISISKGLAVVTCSTMANPNILFTLEV